MADLNALIAQGYQFQPLPDPFVQYGKMQQLENSATQNRLAQQQMTEGTALAPYRLAEAKAKSGSAELELRQTQEAQDFVTGIMQKIKDNHGGIDDPMEAAYQMSLNVNPKVQAIGKNLADAIQLIEGIKQQRAYAQRPTGSVALAAGPAAAPTAAYMPASTQGTLGGPTPAMPSSLGSGTFDVNAPAVSPVANAFATATPAINALRPGAVTAESVADQIRQGNATFGNAPGWTKDREILMKKYEALLNPRERTFAPIDSSKYTQASIQAFNASGDQSDLVPRTAEAGKGYAAINASDYTQESLKKYNETGDHSELVPRAPKSEKVESTIGKVDPDKFTAKSIAKYAKSNNYEDLVLVPPKPTAAIGQGKPPTGYRYDKSGENLEVIPGGPADKQEKLKPIPPNINTAIGTNDMSIKRIEEALDLLKKYPDAIGLKNLLPGQALDRADPKGVAARSAIGDIGSLAIHDRSGAAVSASEMQRLGFIPTPTDRADNAKTKLESMLRWAKAGQQGLSETYSESQGYKPNPALAGKNKAAPANVSNW
jgi:hypothetical protein